jgi:DNA-binding MarR family transcriptional regulator
MSGVPEPIGVQDSLAGLGHQFAREELRSSARILIMLSLGVNRRLGFTALLDLVHCGKGSLNYHLKQLDGAGLVRLSTVFTFGGPRVVVDITEKGISQYQGLVDELRRLPQIEGAPAPVSS